MVLNRTQDFMIDDNTTLTTNSKSIKSAINEVNSSLAQKATEHRIDVTQAPYNAKGDGVSNDTPAFNQAISDAVSSGKPLYVPFTPTGYYWKSPIGVSTDKLKITSDKGAFIVRQAADAVANSYTLSIVQPSQKNVNVTSDIEENDEIITVSDTTGIQIGQVIKITTTEVYTQNGSTGYYYKGWMARVSDILSPTQIKLFEKAPYSFTVSGNTITVDIYNRGDFSIDLNFKWLGNVGSYDVSNLILSNVTNFTINSDVIEGTSSAGISISNGYNGKITCKEMLNRQNNIGLNYGIVANGLFYSTIEGRIYSTRHPISFTGIPSWDVKVINSYLSTWHGDGTVDGCSLDSHCAGKIIVKDSTLPFSIKWSGSYLTIENCELSNVDYNTSGQSLIVHRNSYFTKQIKIVNCKIRLSKYCAYLYSYTPSNYFTDYGDFIFEDNEITSENSNGFLTLLTATSVAIQPNSVGLVSIKNNKFDIFGVALHSVSGSVGLTPPTSGTYVFENNTLHNMDNSSVGAMNTLFGSYTIKNNKTYKKSDRGIYFYGCSAPLQIIVEGNDGIDNLNIASIGNGIIKNNIFRTTTGNGNIVALQNSTTLDISDNVLESKVSANTNWFYVDGVTTAYLGKNLPKVSIATIYNGVPVNVYNEEIMFGTALPTANIRYKGQFFLVLGNGSTTADILYICVMGSTGTYSWKQIIAG